MNLPKINLILQCVMACALGLGMWFARRKQFTLHAWMQSIVVLSNLLLIGRIMIPSFRKQVVPAIPSGLNDRYFAIAFAHGILGALVQLVAVYVVLSAGTPLLPRSLRIQRYRLWMRTTLGLWWLETLLGLGVYSVWYAS